MNLVNQSAFLKALGWSLLDSLWQMGVLWLLYVLLTANGKKFNARQRHTLALLSLAGGTCWFLVTLVINFYKAAAAPEVITLIVNAGEAVSTPSPFKGAVATWLEPVLPFLSVAYLLVTALLFCRFYRQYRYTRQLFRQGLEKINPELRVFLQQAVQHMSISKKVSIWLSSLVDTPLTIGFWKPIILLPIAAVNNLTIEQTEAIILHELNHIRRNDYLINLLIACTDIILFFNPFAQLFSGIIRCEREHSCDDMVLQFRYDASQYARALLTLAQSRVATTPALAVAATGKSNTLLLNRVKRMLTKEPVTTSLNQKLVAWLLSALLIGFIGWYNPGRVIITTMQETAVTTPESPVIEFAADISTPAPPAAVKPGEQAAEEAGIAVEDTDGAAPAETATPSPDPADEDEDADADDAVQQLANYAFQQGQLAQSMVAFVSSQEMRDFSMQAAQEALASVGSITTHPYVPGNSFIIQALEDTLLPKKYTMSVAEKQAKESLDKALKALQEIDWKKIEKGLNASAGNNVDVAQLQSEIKKALKEVDWKKINQETEAAFQEARKEMAEEQAALRIELERYKQARQERQERINQAQYQILLDRLKENEKPASCNTEKKTVRPKVVKTKKVVEI